TKSIYNLRIIASVFLKSSFFSTMLTIYPISFCEYYQGILWIFIETAPSAAQFSLHSTIISCELREIWGSGAPPIGRPRPPEFFPPGAGGRAGNYFHPFASISYLNTRRPRHEKAARPAARAR